MKPFIPSNADSSCRHRRICKPNRRYIDESSDLNSTIVKRRKDTSTSVSRNKCQSVKYNKKPNPESVEIKSIPRDTFDAIQVPFGPLVPEECDKKIDSDVEMRLTEVSCLGRYEHEGKYASDVMKVKSTEISCLDLNEQHYRDYASKQVKLKRLSSIDTDLCSKKHSTDVKRAKMNYLSSFGSGLCDKKHASHVKLVKLDNISFKSQECFKRHSPNVNKVLNLHEDTPMVSTKYDGVMTVISDGDNARRKHHRLWTTSEVRKLVEGVSQCGVGKWSQIKRLYFSSSDYRTPVDLKDKWRNLLKASHLQDQSKKGDKGKHSFSWRPLPKSILNRVEELADIYPYPRNWKSKSQECASMYKSSSHILSNKSI
ncbi:unnamed protein product [Cuscuta epithymum]|uniref:Uncharacterized protein n=1 Tax=Cuscuta epithymum TaxID=186058 RepID=A0AAV0EXF4_9ASTE|nr:unnamed protein product [Cuscuta epithymum]